MNFLALAFGLGGLAVALPILFHLIRRSPRTRQEFSSLLFLQPSPPRLTRRSRLDDWLLLLLRAGVISLIALAFMRPFIRDAGLIDERELVGRRVVILLDSSASMRHDTLWPRAKELAREALKELRVQDDFAIMLFDESTKLLLPFDDLERRQALEVKQELANNILSEQSPSWAGTNLASGLMEALDLIENQFDGQNAALRHRIVLISDIQAGASIEAIQEITWPDQVAVEVRYAIEKPAANATPRLLIDTNNDKKTRLRVTRSAAPGTEQFQLTWHSEKEAADFPPISIGVPAGTASVVEVNFPDGIESGHLRLEGDEVGFDNTYYFVRPRASVPHIVYLGDDQLNDAEGVLYYLARALPGGNEAVKVHPEWGRAGDKAGSGKAPDLIVVSKAITTEQELELQRFVADGGTVLVVAADSGIVSSLSSLLKARPVETSDSPNSTLDRGSQRDRYRLLIDLDFRHPLLQPFASPQFSNFTKIYFWRTQPVKIDDESVSVVARFDDDSPAIWETRIGTGRVVGFASSWRPTDSQLALSSKFVPLINRVLELNPRQRSVSASLVVGEPWWFPQADVESTVTIVRPDGKTETQSTSNEFFAGTDLPGIYHATIGEQSYSFSVNLAAKESDIEIMPLEKLQSLGVRLGGSESTAAEIQALQLLNDRAIESQQKIWKWLIVAALVLIVIETLIAGWRQRRKSLELAAGAVAS
jgi:Mg-chelatase subunit ChlD